MIVTVNNSLDDCLRGFVRVSFDEVWNGRDISRSSDHLLDHGTLIGLTEAITAIILSRSKNSA